MRDEKITALLSKYKSAVLSYSFDNHYKDHKPLEQGFDRCLMTDTKSHLYELITALFLELRLSQAQRYIAAWERTYIIDGWCANKDKESFDGLKAIGRFFIIEAKRIAVEVCEPEGDATPRGWGYLPPEQGTAEKKLNTDKSKELFAKAVKKELVKKDGEKYKWNGSASLYGYFVDKTSDFLNIRHSNNRIPWKMYGTIITNHSEILETARQAVNDYKNKGLPPPEGDDIVNDICK